MITFAKCGLILIGSGYVFLAGYYLLLGRMCTEEIKATYMPDKLPFFISGYIKDKYKQKHFLRQYVEYRPDNVPIKSNLYFVYEINGIKATIKPMHYIPWRIRKKLARNTQYTVYVDPTNPRKMALTRRPYAEQYVISLLMLIVGLVVMFGGYAIIIGLI